MPSDAAMTKHTQKTAPSGAGRRTRLRVAAERTSGLTGILWRHLHSNIVGYFALVLALSAGAYAAGLPRDSVNSATVKDETLKSVDLKNGTAVRGADVKESSIRSSDIADNDLTGADVNESSLSPVPYALSALTASQGGLGRYGFTGSCDPESETYIPCSIVRITLTAPARLLVIGTVRAYAEGGADNGYGWCRIGTTSGPVPASTDYVVTGEQPANLTFIAVTDPFPVGTHSVGIDCNQRAGAGAIEYFQARVTTVALSAN